MQKNLISPRTIKLPIISDHSTGHHIIHKVLANFLPWEMHKLHLYHFWIEICMGVETIHIHCVMNCIISGSELHVESILLTFYVFQYSSEFNLFNCLHIPETPLWLIWVWTILHYIPDRYSTLEKFLRLCGWIVTDKKSLYCFLQ